MYFKILHCGRARVKRFPMEDLAEASRADEDSEIWENHVCISWAASY